MSTYVFLVCEDCNERVQTSPHRAKPFPTHRENGRMSQFCYRHMGHTLRSYNEHSGEPWGADDMPNLAIDKYGEVPRSGGAS